MATDAPNQTPSWSRTALEPAGSSTDASSRGMSGSGDRRALLTSRALA